MALAHRLRLYFERNERMLAPAFFAAGFVFDVLTLGRIDSWLTIGQQAAYLALITVVLAHAFIEEGREPAPAGHGTLAGGYYRWRMPAVHFLLGALLNLYTIFYFKSSSLGVSFAFMAALVLLLLANELPRFKALGPAFRFALLALCYLSFFAYVLPVLTGSIGLVSFLLALGVGALPLVAVALRVRATAPAQFSRARRQILVPLGAVLLGYLVFYLFRLVPPVPLSIPFIGVYHGVEKAAEGYRLSHERDAWRFWHNGDQDFRAQPGDKVYVYFRVFSPARFSDQVLMRWYRKEAGWALQDTIPIRIAGGREEGFRGYGVKSNYQPGRWKVQVETTDGREIGRIYLELRAVPEAPRGFAVQVD